ncbi:MAG: response regulator transcription factor [Bacteroidetes bacterium]|nr:response regulator transcription factor [Bacteroidota bacterium]
MCQIIILENYSLFSAGIKAILSEINEFEIIGEAKIEDNFLRQFREIKPDVIIVDIIHCENEGIKPIKKIKKYFSKIPILLIVSEDYANYFEEYIALGIKGFVFRDASPGILVKAIKKLKNGEDYFRKDVWIVLKDFIRSRKSHKFKKAEKSLLTNREIAVLKLFSKGQTYKEIGVDLNISPRTVESHKKNILTKLEIRSTAEMVRYAFNNQIL